MSAVDATGSADSSEQQPQEQRLQGPHRPRRARSGSQPAPRKANGPSNDGKLPTPAPISSSASGHNADGDDQRQTKKQQKKKKKKKKKKAALAFSWSDVLQLPELSRLRKIFVTHGGEFSEKEFVRQLRLVISTSTAMADAEIGDTAGGQAANEAISSEALSHLFMKIDANSDGTVSWDEFVSFLFLSNAESDASGGTGGEGGFGGDGKVGGAKIYELGAEQLPSTHHHNSAITMLLKVDGHPEHHTNPNSSNRNRGKQGGSEDGGSDNEQEQQQKEVTDTRGDLYLTGGTDGQLLAWDSHTLAYHNTLGTGLDWVVGSSHMTHTSRLVVATTSRVHMYEVFKDRKKVLQTRPVGIVPPQVRLVIPWAEVCLSMSANVAVVPYLFVLLPVSQTHPLFSSPVRSIHVSLFPLRCSETLALSAFTTATSLARLTSGCSWVAMTDVLLASFFSTPKTIKSRDTAISTRWKFQHT